MSRTREQQHEGRFEIASLNQLDAQRARIQRQKIIDWYRAAPPAVQEKLAELLKTREIDLANPDHFLLSYYLYALEQGDEFDAEETLRVLVKNVKVRPASAEAVYLCIKQEHENLGKTDRELEEAAASDFAKFAVFATSAGLGGTRTPNAQGFAGDIARVAHDVRNLGLRLAQILHQSVNAVIGQFPFMQGLNIKSTRHDIEHHLEKIPIPVLIQTVEFLKSEALASGTGATAGLQRQQLGGLEKLIRHIEDLAAEKMGKEIIAEAGSDLAKAHEKVQPIVNRDLRKPVRELRTDRENVMAKLKTTQRPKETGTPEAVQRGIWRKIYEILHGLVVITQTGEIAKWLFGGDQNKGKGAGKSS